MKTFLIGLLAVAVVTGWLFAQGRVVSSPVAQVPPGYIPGPYVGRTPPPVSLQEAYDLALAHIGVASNSFYCIRASCVDSNGNRGWTFTFANTNGQRGWLVVYFSKGVSPMSQDGARMYFEK